MERASKMKRASRMETVRKSERGAATLSTTLATALVALIALAFAVVLAPSAFTEDEAPGEAKPQEEAVNPMEVMAYLGEVHKKGKHQQALARMAGTWKASGKFWMMPGQPPMQSVGTSVNTMVMDGKYIRFDYETSIMGQPYKGHGMMAHDNLKKTYQMTWLDNSPSSSGILWSEGSISDDMKTITFHGEADSGKYGKHKTRMVFTLNDDGSHMMQGYQTHGEQEMQLMEIVYTSKEQGEK